MSRFPRRLAELALTALGGNFDHDTTFTPPASARRIRLNQPPDNLFDAFAIERWRQRTVLGRDIVVEVVYKGFLFPLGHRAALVKVTERRFEQIHPDGEPVAVLIQHQFLQIGQPEKTFPAYQHPNRGCRWPAERVTLLTRRTPDLVDPILPSGGQLIFGTGQIFWPRTAARNGAEVKFEIRVDGEAMSGAMPLIFVDNTAVHDKTTVKALVDWYNDAAVGGTNYIEPEMRKLPRHGQSARMAPPRKEGDTSLVTDWWDLRAEGRLSGNPPGAQPGPSFMIDNRNHVMDPFMEGLDQPGFYPFVNGARCRLAQIERFTGKQTVWAEVAYDGFYVANGFVGPKDEDAVATANEVFLRLTGLEPIKMRMGGADRAGGIASPDLDVIGISRAVGPIGRATFAPTPAASIVHDGPTTLASISDYTDRPNIAAAPGVAVPMQPTIAEELFPADAKLLGLIKLQDVVKVTTVLASQPRLREIAEYGAAGATGNAVRAYITANVLQPIGKMLGELDALWARVAGKAYANVKLADAYPQIGTALTALRTSVQDALDPARDDVAFLASLAVIYEAGRSFIAVIESVLRDPLASISEAQASQLNALVGEIRILIAAAADFPAEMRSLAATLQAKITGWLVDETLDGWRRLLFALPLPDPALSTAIREAFYRASEAALRDALADALASSPPNWDLASLPGQVAAKLRASADGGPLGTALSQAAAEVEAIAADRASQSLTPYAVRTLALLRKLREASDKIATGLQGDVVAVVTAVLEAAGHALEAAATIFADTARIAVQDEQILCRLLVEKAAPAFAALAKAMIAADGTTADDCDLATTAFKQVAGDPALTTPPTPPTQPVAPTLADTLATLLYATRCLAYVEGQVAAAPVAALTGLSDLRRKLAHAGEGLASAAGHVVRALGGLVPPPLPAPAVCTGLPAGFTHSLSALVAAQKEFAAALNGLATVFAAPPAGVTVPATPTQVLAAVVTWAASQDDSRWTALLPGLRAGGEALRVAGLGAVRLLQTASLLGTVGDAVRQGQLTQAADGLDAIGTALGTGYGPDRLHAVAGLLRGAPTALRTLQTNALAAANALAAIPLAAIPDRAAMQAFLVNLGPELVLASNLANAVQTEVRTAIEDQAIALVTSLQLAQQEIGGRVLKAGIPLIKPLVGGLATVYRVVTEGRDKLKTLVTGAGSPQGSVIEILLGALRARLGETLLEAPLAAGDKPDAAKVCGAGCDRLAYENALAMAASQALVDGHAAEAAPLLATLVRLWSPIPAIVILIRQFTAIDADFARTLILSAIDLKAVRREVEARIRELIPARITLPYDLDTQLGPVPPIFVPNPGTRLQLHAQTVIHLLPDENGIRPPTFSVTGQMGPFAVRLLGDPFDVVTLNFHGLTFSAGSGASADFQVRFRSVEMGRQASFLQPLQDFLSPKAGGFYITALQDGPGIEAGYGINLGVIGVGALSFSNVILNAAVRLPFGGGKTNEARFVISIGRQDAPFLISSTIFGGGGYLALIADTQKFVGFEASFDYGGVAAFGFGPLQGIGRLTMGIYLRKEGNATTLGATFFVGGAAHIACFGMSTSLCVRLLHSPGGSMQGSAEYTYSFSLGIDDIDFHVSVQRNEGAGVGTNAQAAVLPSVFEQRIRYAQVTEVASDARPSGPPELKVVGTPQSRDWRKYRAYFDPSLQPARKPRRPA